MMSITGSPRRYSIIIPAILTLFFFASLAGIIGNAFTLSSLNTTRSFDIDNLAPNEVQDAFVTIPSSFSQVSMSFTISKSFSFDDLDSLGQSGLINLYLFEEALPDELTTLTALRASDYYVNQRIGERIEVIPEVSSDVNFYLNDPGAGLYVVVANVDTEEINLSIDIYMSESDPGSGESASRVIAIVFASIFTLLFMLAAGYGWFEYFVDDWYKPRVLTPELEDRLTKIADKSQSWESLAIVIGIIFIVVGYSTWLIGQSEPFIFLGGFLLVLVYYNYTTRDRIEKNIKSVLSQHTTIPLEELSELIEQDKEKVKRTLLNMIMYDEFPATYDFQTEQVIYDASKQPAVITPKITVKEAYFDVAKEDVASEEVKETPTTDRPLPTCAYCGEEAITYTAQFCHACGASMSSAK